MIFSGPNGGANAWLVNSSKPFQIQQGALRLAAANALGNSGNSCVVSSGAACEFQGGFNHNVSNGNITLNGTGIGGTGTIRALSGNNTISAINTSTGAIVLNTDSSIGVDATNGLRTNQNNLKLGGLLGDKDLAAVFTTDTGGYDNITSITLTPTVGKSLSYSGVIDGARSLTKAGPGAQTLAGANTYTGGTSVTEGGLSFLNTDAKPATGTHAFDAGTTLGLGVSGANAFTTTDIANAFAGFTNNAALVFNSDSAQACDNAISGIGTLTKLGAGTLTLTSTNTYTGATTVTSGTLALGASASFPNSNAFNIAAGAVLDTSAKTTFAMAAAKPYTFGINPVGSGTSGTLTAQELDITNAVVALDITGTLVAPAYVLATYSTLNGTGIGGSGALRSLGGTKSITGSGTGGINLATNASIGADAGSLTITHRWTLVLPHRHRLRHLRRGRVFRK